MNDHAEYVSPGHPDRLADAIAEGIVTAALQQKRDALVGVEVAVHRGCVFIDGRIAAGPTRVDVDRIVRDVYQRAGYGGPWMPAPGNLVITTDLCEEELPEQEADIRPYSDDQNIVIGYACGATMLVCLVVMKFVGPPPAAFPLRAGLVSLMLVATAMAGGRRPAAASSAAVGLILLGWYARE